MGWSCWVPSSSTRVLPSLASTLVPCGLAEKLDTSGANGLAARKMAWLVRFRAPARNGGTTAMAPSAMALPTRIFFHGRCFMSLRLFPTARPRNRDAAGSLRRMAEFLTDIQTLRQRAREHIEKGPVTDAYGADRERVIAVLNEALATELVCVLRYKRHYYMASGLESGPVAAEFLQHATDEQGHADSIAARIVQLQGEPDFNPSTLLSRSHAEYVEGNDLRSMVTEDLVAERVAIASYQEIIRWLDDNDPTTRNLLETILAVEEEHADDLLGFLNKV